jgi:hypothetical protein
VPLVHGWARCSRAAGAAIVGTSYPSSRRIREHG